MKGFEVKKVFVDFEMNPVARQNREVRQACRSEIIEIGAVMLDEDNEVVKSYREYVLPAYNDRVTEKIKELTGIDYSMLEGSDQLAPALEKFLEWCGPDCTVYSWSTSDSKQLKAECRVKGISLDGRLGELLATWIDFQKEFGDLCHLTKSVSLDKAVEIAGLDFSGAAHDAATDALNTAYLYRITKDDEAFARIRRILDDAFSEHSFSMGDLFDFSSL